MHQWSLFVQSLTLLSGIMIKTDQFTEILGEKGGQGRAALGGILVFFHFFVAVTPILKTITHTLYLWYVASQRDNSKPAASFCCSAGSVEEGDADMDTPQAASDTLAGTATLPKLNNGFQGQQDAGLQQPVGVYAHAPADPAGMEISCLQVEGFANIGLDFGNLAMMYHSETASNSQTYPNVRNNPAASSAGSLPEGQW